jgi:predicted nucleic acid-binding protein
MIVADTSVWIDYLRGVAAPHTDLLDQALGSDRVVTGDIIMVEFLQGFREDKDFATARQIMQALEYHDFLGGKNAMQSAMYFRMLRKKGITIRKTIDIMIATFCIENDFELIHNDRDFDPMEEHLGLKVRR